jgi:hypothetical protein
MSYKIFIETDDIFKIGCCEFDSFLSAKHKVGEMIVDLMESNKERDFAGCWDEFKEEFPQEILSIIEGFEQTGLTPAVELSMEGDTVNYHYSISDNILEIIDSENAEYAPSYSLQTNMLGMSDESSDYFFRIWSGISMMEQAIIIRLEKI